jgi:hypothetical protein
MCVILRCCLDSLGSGDNSGQTLVIVTTQGKCYFCHGVMKISSLRRIFLSL